MFFVGSGALCVLTIIIAVHDARTQRIPNALVVPAIVVAMLMTITAAATGRGSPLAGALSWWLLFSGFHLLALRRGTVRGAVGGSSVFGGGDAKLALVVGTIAAWSGYIWWLVGLGIAGVLFSVRLSVAQAGRDLGRTAAFGPAMIAGAWIAAGVGCLVAQCTWLT